MQVTNNKSTPIGLKFAALDQEPSVDITLKPGGNKVDDKVWASARRHKMVQAHIDAGHIDDGTAPKRDAGKKVEPPKGEGKDKK